MYNLWSPKLKRGFFFVGDQQFYLFTDKQTIALLNALFFEFALDQFPASILEATCGTKTIVADDMIVDDRKVMFRNSALEDGHDIILTYTVQEISGDQIIQTPQVVSLDPVDATRRFFLDPVPVSGYPIIFTDDSISPFNGNEYMHSEFDVDEDTGEVTFFGADKNKLWNAAFSAWNTAPLNWTVSTDIVSLEHLRQEGYLTKDSIMFGRIPDVPSWDDYLFQKIVIEEKEETFTLSFWTKTWQ